MITREQYFGAKPHTEAQATAADALLAKTNALQAEYRAATGVPENIDPDTGTEISGSKGGSGDGGFRLDTATTGRIGSAHKVLPAEKPLGAAVDCSDQGDGLDAWLDTFEHDDGGNTKLEEYALYREHPRVTRTWCHLTDRAPGSGRRTYYP